MLRRRPLSVILPFMIENLDAIVVLGGPTDKESQHRVDTMIDLLRAGVSEEAIVTGAFWAFSATEKPTSSIGQRSKEYAISKGVPADAITVADRCVDTIGDALDVKKVTQEQGWRRLGLVTTESHMPRSIKGFTHVMGPDYKIIPHSAGTFARRRGQGMYEHLGSMLCNAVLDGTEPGDDAAIRERLFALVPGYTTASKPAIAMNHVRKILHLSLVSATPLDTLV